MLSNAVICLMIIIREYFLRRVRDEFRENRNIQDSMKITDLLKRAEENLRVLRRQVRKENPINHQCSLFLPLVFQALIENLYAPSQPSILEKRSISTSSIPS